MPAGKRGADDVALFKFVEYVGGLVVADAEPALEIRRADLLVVDDDLKGFDDFSNRQLR